MAPTPMVFGDSYTARVFALNGIMVVYPHAGDLDNGPLKWALYDLVDYSVIRGWDFTLSGQQQATSEIANVLGKILELCEGVS
jgi:hypothetical protein